MTDQCLPIGVDEAQAIGLVDDIVRPDDLDPGGFRGFCDQVGRMAEGLARSPRYGAWLDQKRATREMDERIKPLERHRCDELDEMRKNFWGADSGYHVARSAFVRKKPRAITANASSATAFANGMSAVATGDMAATSAM